MPEKRALNAILKAQKYARTLPRELSFHQFLEFLLPIVWKDV